MKPSTKLANAAYRGCLDENGTHAIQGVRYRRDGGPSHPVLVMEQVFEAGLAASRATACHVVVPEKDGPRVFRQASGEFRFGPELLRLHWRRVDRPVRRPHH